jgi:hypothetical protein
MLLARVSEYAQVVQVLLARVWEKEAFSEQARSAVVTSSYMTQKLQSFHVIPCKHGRVH